MDTLKYFFAFMMLEAVLLGGVIGFFAEPSTAHFIRSSPWMLLYYAPFAALFAFAQVAREKHNP